MTILLTPKQFTQKHPAFPIGGLRHEIFNEETTGLKESGAIIRSGRKVLIDEQRYFEWLAVKNGKTPDWFNKSDSSKPTTPLFKEQPHLKKDGVCIFEGCNKAEIYPQSQVDAYTIPVEACPNAEYPDCPTCGKNFAGGK